MDFSLTSVMNDAAIMSLLLLIGVALRARVRWVQKLFLPASIIAGLLGLALGPNGLSWAPFSGSISQYPGLLITFIFASLALSTEKIKFSTVAERAGSMWSFGALGMIGMYGGGVLVAMVLLQPFWSSLPDGFGILLAAGFIGGHGSAAAIGSVFAANGWPEATSLAMTSATIGVLASILGGIAIIRRSAKRGQTSFISDFDQLPTELRSGLVPEHKRTPEVVETISSMTIDPLLFHALLVTLIAGASFWVQAAISWAFDFSAPAFALAFVIGLIANAILGITRAKQYVSPPVLNRIGGFATDILVAFGIASINLAVVADYFLPLLLLLIFGVVFSYGFLMYLSPKLFADHWFEKGLFGWGWFTGTVAMGIALLRIVDPKMKSRTLDEFGLSYIFLAPIEIALVTFSPLILLAGNRWIYVAVSIALCIGIIVLSRRLGWYRSHR